MHYWAQRAVKCLILQCYAVAVKVLGRYEALFRVYLPQ